MLLAAAFTAHPYRNASASGSPRASAAESFFQKHYAPAGITVAIAGDIGVTEAKRLAQKYFAALAARPAPARNTREEIAQEGSRRVEVEFPGRPMVLAGYKRPDERHADDAVLDILAVVLSGGKNGWLYRDLVAGSGVAEIAYATPSFPGGRFPNLFLVSAIAANGRGADEVEKAIQATLDRLKEERIGEEALERAKRRTRATFVQQLETNAGMARALAFFRARYGDWRKITSVLDEIGRVTEDDVRRAARAYFVARGRTVAVSVTPESGGAR